MAFQKAVKYEAKLRLAITGPSGAGKTFTALTLASYLLAGTGKRIAVIDTEHGSASKYADIFDFDADSIDAPYNPDRFVLAIQEAEKAGYGVIIIDSVTHAWNGPGGVLDIKEQFAKQKGYNDFTAWKPAGEYQQRLVEAILSANLHVIVTMRSKTVYESQKVEENGRERTKIVKMGAAPQQRDGFEFEFDIMLDLDIDNTAYVNKTRCPELTGGVYPKPNGQLASIILNWLAGNPAPEKPNKAPIGVDPKVAFWNVLKIRLQQLGRETSNPKAALLSINTPWAQEAINLIETGAWQDAMRLDMSADPTPE